MRHAQNADGAAARASIVRRGYWSFRRVMGLVVTWLVLLVPAPGWGEELSALTKPPLIPGTEIRIEDSRTGGLGYWTLYLPPDYSADQRWPILFNFHGLNQAPTLWPFAELTEHRGFIIVGMEYLRRGLEGINRAAEAENLKRVLATVSQWVSLDEQRLFVGGFSKGGWHTSQIAERTADIWAGVLILGAGRSASPDASGLKDKPVFIGIGEFDGENGSAAAAADFYRGIGAQVTFVRFAGIAHSVDVENRELKKWLADKAGLQLQSLVFKSAR